MGKIKRELTTILHSVGGEKINDGSDITRQQQVARNYWDLATNGKVEFPDGREVKASVKDWKDCVQWIYTHIDGPVRFDQLEADGFAKVFEDTPMNELLDIVSKTTGRLKDSDLPQAIEG